MKTPLNIVLRCCEELSNRFSFFSFFTLKMLDLFSQFWNPEPFTIADAMRNHKPSGSGVEIAVFTRLLNRTHNFVILALAQWK